MDFNAPARDEALRAYAADFEKITGAATRENLDVALCNLRAADWTRRAAECAAIVFSGQKLCTEVHFWRAKIAAELWAIEARYAKIAEAVSSPNYAYTTSGHPVSPNKAHVYHQDHKSPTGVVHAISIDWDDKRGMALLAAAGHSANTMGGCAGAGGGR